MRKSSFPPVCDGSTRVLVLGSLPGEESLRQQQYYANPRNGFWRLMEAVLEEDLASRPYEERTATLLRRRLGLWDSIGSAARVGSLDAAILDPIPNDLAGFAAGLPELRAVAFNGGKAAQLGEPLLAGAPVERVRLPSSSPAHAVTFERKAEAWLRLRRFLDD